MGAILFRSLGLLTPLCLAVGAAQAADGFHVRYSMYGGVGASIFSKSDRSGWSGGVSTSYSESTRLTGNDGASMVTLYPGGTASLGLGAGNPTYPANPVQVHAGGFSRHVSVGVSFLTEPQYARGRLAFGMSTGYGIKSQAVSAIASTPALSWPGVANPALEAAFGAVYQARIAALAAAETTTDEGRGDSDLSVQWIRQQDNVRWNVGLSLIVPTGKYSSTPGSHIGYGDYYTLRPSVQASWLPQGCWGLGGRLTLGLNTKNRQNQVHSGDWAALEGAVGCMSPLGPIGVQWMRVQQFRDDQGGAWGTNRLRISNAGLFAATRIPVLDASLSFNMMQTLESRNAKEGRFMQIRLSRQF